MQVTCEHDNLHCSYGWDNVISFALRESALSDSISELNTGGCEGICRVGRSVSCTGVSKKCNQAHTYMPKGIGKMHKKGI